MDHMSFYSSRSCCAQEPEGFGNGHAFQVLMKCDSVFIFSTASLYYERTCAYVMSSIRGSLDSCPVELCDRIFEFACTDAGYTGRSLSLVSKYVNQTSKRYMLQCRALHGVDKIVAFVGVLERTSKELRRSAIYLFVMEIYMMMEEHRYILPPRCFYRPWGFRESYVYAA
jgi:hypothetical protein